jgi:hypothetical protein
MTTLKHTPDCYLSTSGGKWRLIYQGLPLCADGSKERAENVARHYKFDPAALETWNGDAGKWVNP